MYIFHLVHSRKTRRKFPTLHSSNKFSTTSRNLAFKLCISALQHRGRAYRINLRLALALLTLRGFSTVRLWLCSLLCFLSRLLLPCVPSDIKIHPISSTPHRKGYSPTRTLSRNSEVVFYIYWLFSLIYTPLAYQRIRPVTLPVPFLTRLANPTRCPTPNLFGVVSRIYLVFFYII
jgi:hypothetical protein